MNYCYLHSARRVWRYQVGDQTP